MEALNSTGGSVFGLVTFCLVVYIMCTMATKKDVRKLANGDLSSKGDSRERELRAMLHGYKGRECTLILADASITANGTRLTGTLEDMDDGWLRMSCPQKKAPAQLKVLRISLVEGIEQQTE